MSHKLSLILVAVAATFSISGPAAAQTGSAGRTALSIYAANPAYFESRTANPS